MVIVVAARDKTQPYQNVAGLRVIFPTSPTAATAYVRYDVTAPASSLAACIRPVSASSIDSLRPAVSW